MPRSIWLLALAGCAFEPLSGERLCQEVGFGIASRTFECTADEDRAQRSYEQLFETHTCTIAEVDDLSTLTSAQTSWFACPAAMLLPECDAVADNAEDARWWLAQEETCAALFEGAALDTTPETDTGEAPCTSTQDEPDAPEGSCGSPHQVWFVDKDRYTSTEVAFAQAVDEPCVDACGTTTATDTVLRVWVDEPSTLQLTLLSAPKDALVTTFRPSEGCDETPMVCEREPETVTVDFTEPGYVQIALQTETATAEGWSLRLDHRKPQ